MGIRVKHDPSARTIAGAAYTVGSAEHRAARAAEKRARREREEARETAVAQAERAREFQAEQAREAREARADAEAARAEVGAGRWSVEREDRLRQAHYQRLDRLAREGRLKEAAAADLDFKEDESERREIARVAAMEEKYMVRQLKLIQGLKNGPLKNKGMSLYQALENALRNPTYTDAEREDAVGKLRKQIQEVADAAANMKTEPTLEEKKFAADEEARKTKIEQDVVAAEVTRKDNVAKIEREIRKGKLDRWSKRRSELEKRVDTIESDMTKERTRLEDKINKKTGAPLYTEKAITAKLKRYEDRLAAAETRLQEHRDAEPGVESEAPLPDPDDTEAPPEPEGELDISVSEPEGEEIEVFPSMNEVEAERAQITKGFEGTPEEIANLRGISDEQKKYLYAKMKRYIEAYYEAARAGDMKKANEIMIAIQNFRREHEAMTPGGSW